MACGGGAVLQKLKTHSCEAPFGSSGFDAVEFVLGDPVPVLPYRQGDVDGVVIVPRAAAAEVARLASDRFAKESKTRERLKNGELGLDFYGLRAKLTELGVRYEDGTE